MKKIDKLFTSRAYLSSNKMVLSQSSDMLGYVASGVATKGVFCPTGASISFSLHFQLNQSTGSLKSKRI